MVRILGKVVRWLESRFPEKMTVHIEDYQALRGRLEKAESTLKDNDLSLNKVLERLSVVEGNAVHKDPVKVIVEELAKLKADHMSFKASMGFRTDTVQQAEIQAILNGEPL